MSDGELGRYFVMVDPPAQFDQYVRARTLEEALEIAAEEAIARTIISGVRAYNQEGEGE